MSAFTHRVASTIHLNLRFSYCVKLCVMIEDNPQSCRYFDIDSKCHSKAHNYETFYSCFKICTLPLNLRFLYTWLQTFWWLGFMTSSRCQHKSEIVLHSTVRIRFPNLISMDIILLSRSAFEILDFKLLGVWPWRSPEFETFLPSIRDLVYIVRRPVCFFATIS